MSRLVDGRQVDIPQMLRIKSNVIFSQYEQLLELAMSYYIQNGRGAVVMTYENIGQLMSKNARILLVYMPLEIAAETKRKEDIALLLEYDPGEEFVIFMSLRNNRVAYEHIALYGKNGERGSREIQTRF
jgi:hypothetical protein